MLYVIRPSPGRLALADTETDRLVLVAGQFAAMPDAAFWAALRARGLDAQMKAENPARWERMQKNGIGELRQEKDILTRAGLTRANAHSKAPTPSTVEVALEIKK